MYKSNSDRRNGFIFSQTSFYETKLFTLIRIYKRHCVILSWDLYLTIFITFLAMNGIVLAALSIFVTTTLSNFSRISEFTCDQLSSATIVGAAGNCTLDDLTTYWKIIRYFWILFLKQIFLILCYREKDYNTANDYIQTNNNMQFTSVIVCPFE